METILFVEDSPDDQFMFDRTMRQLPFKANVRFANSGDQAVSYLDGKGPFSDRQRFPIPTVIFMDIKMPGKSGLDVLNWVKRESPNDLNRIPVIMFSSSGEQHDINRAYDLGANAYLVKPMGFQQLQRLFKTTGEFFLDHAQKPSVKVENG